jgi:hypothetical protein
MSLLKVLGLPQTAVSKLGVHLASVGFEIERIEESEKVTAQKVVPK